MFNSYENTDARETAAAIRMALNEDVVILVKYSYEWDFPVLRFDFPDNHHIEMTIIPDMPVNLLIKRIVEIRTEHLQSLKS